MHKVLVMPPALPGLGAGQGRRVPRRLCGARVAPVPPAAGLPSLGAAAHAARVVPLLACYLPAEPVL